MDSKEVRAELLELLENASAEDFSSASSEMSEESSSEELSDDSDSDSDSKPRKARRTEAAGSKKKKKQATAVKKKKTTKKPSSGKIPSSFTLSKEDLDSAEYCESLFPFDATGVLSELGLHECDKGGKVTEIPAHRLAFCAPYILHVSASEPKGVAVYHVREQRTVCNISLPVGDGVDKPKLAVSGVFAADASSVFIAFSDSSARVISLPSGETTATLTLSSEPDLKHLRLGTVLEGGTAVVTPTQVINIDTAQKTGTVHSVAHAIVDATTQLWRHRDPKTVRFVHLVRNKGRGIGSKIHTEMSVTEVDPETKSSELVSGPMAINMGGLGASFFGVDHATGLCGVGAQCCPEFHVYDLTSKNKRAKCVGKFAKLGDTIHISAFRHDSKFSIFGVAALPGKEAATAGDVTWPSFVLCNTNNAEDATLMKINLKASTRVLKAPVSERTKRKKRKAAKRKRGGGKECKMQ